MKMDASMLSDLSSFEQAEQLEDAISIMAERLDGSGVAEPIIRPRGENAIEIQMPGASKQNPEIIDIIKKPARLEFRTVHASLEPDTTPTSEYPVGYEVLAEEIEDRKMEVYERRMFVKRIPEATGEIVEDAFASQTLRGDFRSI